MVHARVLAGKRKRERISFVDFLVGYEGIAAEWVDGEVETLRVSNLHSQLNVFLVALMGRFVRQRDLERSDSSTL